MILSVAITVLSCLLISWVFRMLKIPGLVGMLLVGVLFGPYLLVVLDPSLLAVSGDIRTGALIVILLQAGLKLSGNTLKKVGKTALLLSFIPAIFEAVVIMMLSPALLGLSYMEGAILGTIVAAVSPAVVVPIMLKFMNQKKGTRKGIPTLMLAASSVDDVFVIIVYSVLIGIYTGQEINIVWKLAGIPISIISGIAVGIIAGWGLFLMFKHFPAKTIIRVLTILGIAVLLMHAEHLTAGIFPFSGLIAIMVIGFVMVEKHAQRAGEISMQMAKLWVFAEIMLFTLVGAEVNIDVAFDTGLAGIGIIFCGLAARSAGVLLCLIASGLNAGEKLFVTIAYIPKATVQAAIGGAPLAAMKFAGMDSAPGEAILAVAVLSIVLTAPLGAWGIAFAGEKFLDKEE